MKKNLTKSAHHTYLFKKNSLSKISIALIGLLSLQLVVSSLNAEESAPVKSSAIPDKREFLVNEKISPCENFYEYACSDTISKFQLRDDRSRHTFAFDDSSERLLEFKKKYMQKLSTITPKSPREKAIKNVYLACVDETARKTEEKQIVEKTLSILKNIKTKEEMLNFLGKNTLAAEFSLVSFDAQNKLKDPLHNDLFLDINILSYPEKSYYEKEENIKDLEIIVSEFYKTIGLDQTQERAKKLVELEKEFVKVYPTPVEWRELETSEAVTNINAMLKNYPNLKLGDLFKKVPTKIIIRDLEPKVLAFMNEKLNQMSLEELKDLYLYHELIGYLDDAYPEFFNKRFDFNFKHLGGPKVRPERKERCTQLVMRKYPKDIDSILLNEWSKNFPKKRVVQLGEKIRESLLDSLNKNTWLTDSAKKEALLKVKKVKLQLVSPDNEKDWGFNPLADYKPDQAIQNAKKFIVVLKNKSLDQLKKKNNPNEWIWGPLIVNAYYAPEYNKFVLPMGILQPPFFDASLSDEENLASLGTVIGHEIGHGIDDQGAKFDAYGILKDWRTEKDHKAFEERTKILIEQFNKAGHNGELTLGENIGDNVGLSMSFKAASKNKKLSPDEVKKFFLAYSHLWCGVTRPSAEEQQLKTNPHAMGWARVNEQVKQQAEFKKAFSCKDTDKMVLPEEKVIHIW